MSADREQSRRRDRLALSDGVVAFTPQPGERNALHALRGRTLAGGMDYRRDGRRENWDFSGARIRVNRSGDASLILGRVLLDSDPGIPLRDAAISFDRSGRSKTPIITLVFPGSVFRAGDISPYQVKLVPGQEPVISEVKPNPDTRALETRRIARNSWGEGLRR